MQIASIIMSLLLVLWGVAAEFILLQGGASHSEVIALKRDGPANKRDRTIYQLLKWRMFIGWLGLVSLLVSILAWS